MHDSIFEHEINIFSINKIYLMGRFRPCYVFIPLGLYFITIMLSSPQKDGDFFFSLCGVLLWRTLVEGGYLEGCCFLVLGESHLRFSSLNPPQEKSAC